MKSERTLWLFAAAVGLAALLLFLFSVDIL